MFGHRYKIKLYATKKIYSLCVSYLTFDEKTRPKFNANLSVTAKIFLLKNYDEPRIRL